MSAVARDPEFYLSHSGYVRRLARALVFDEHAAADVEQQTWLAALQNGPREPGAARGWLRALARNFAAKARRGEARRSEREEGFARARGPVATPEEVLEHESARRRVVEHLLALEEPYRSVLIARYFDDESPPAIAVRLGIPLETVRTRLKRGLERLRVRMRDEYGGFFAWGAVLSRSLRLTPPPSASLTTSIPGVITMSFAKKVACSLSLAALFGVLSWVAATALRAPAKETVVETPAADLEPVASALSAPVAEAATSAEREALVVPLPPVADAANTEPKGALDVFVQWHDGTPAAGVGVYLEFPVGVRDEQVVTAQRSDEHGRAGFADLPPGQAIVQLDRGAYDTAQIEPGERSALTIVLARGFDVGGRVVDAFGRPVAGARIFLWHGTRPMLELAEVAVSDARGGFELRSIESGPTTLICARAAGFAPTRRHELAASEGATLSIELAFPDRPSAQVRGRVLDEFGLPIAAARVLVGPEDSWSPVTERDGSTSQPAIGEIVIADEDGNFRAAGVPAEMLEFRARARGFAPGRWEIDAGTTEYVELRLERAPAVRGTIRDAAGAALERVFVSCGETYEFATTHAVTGADGGFVLSDLPLGEVRLVADGGRRGRTHVSMTLLPGQEATWHPVLSLGLAIRGRIELPAGESFDGWQALVEPLANANLGGRRFALVDDEGRFAFEGLADVDHRVRACPPGEEYVVAVCGIEPVRPGPGEIVLHPQMLAGVRIVGRACKADGKPLESVPLYPIGAALVYSRELVADAASGRFAIGPLPPGEWGVHFAPRGVPPRTVGPRALGAGETWDLGDVTFEPGGTIRIELDTAADVASTPAWIEVLDQGGVSVAWIEAADGAWRSGPLAPGNYRVVPGGAEDIALVPAAVEVRSEEEASVRLRLRRGVSVRLHYRDESGEAPADRVAAELVGDGGALRYDLPVLRSPAGLQSSVALLPGAYRVRATGPGGTSGEVEFTVVAGTALEDLELVLSVR